MNSSEKTAALLKLLGESPYVHGVTELGQQIDCSKSGTYKLLSALVASGLAAQTPEHKYTLGPAVYLLGKTYEEQIGLSEIIRPYLVRLRDETGENANFSMLVDGKAKLLYREESRNIIRVAGKVGEERPLYAGANSKVLGAFLDEDTIRKRLEEEPPVAYTDRTITDLNTLLGEYMKIRGQGYAISDGELNEEMIGIGAPVRDASRRVWAAISIAAPRMRVDEVKKERYIELLKTVAWEMSEKIPYGRS